MIVVPPAPFPPVGGEAEGTLDLGVRLRDQLFTGAVLRGPLRRALQGRLGQAIDGAVWGEASALLRAWLDTFPVGALVDGARQAWTVGPDGDALAVLGRAAEIVRLAMGWEMGDDGPWPWPSEQWIEGTVGRASVAAVLQRDPDDGAPQLAALLGDVPVDRGALDDVPPHGVVPGIALADRRAQLGGWLARGELVAVRVRGEVPDDIGTTLALGEMRLEGSAQAAFERWGVAGLRAGRVPDWQDQLQRRAVAPVVGVLARRCSSAMIPCTPARLLQGDTKPVGWLLWEAPVAPLAVRPAAVAVLDLIDGERSLDEIARALVVPVEAVREVASELCRVGAAGPA